MRIAQLTQSYPPMVSGAAIVSQRLVEGFSKSGHQVLVLTASDQPKPYSSISGNVTVDRCRSMHNPFRVGQRFTLWSRRSITQDLEKFSPDIIHLHDPLQLALFALRYGEIKNVPVIMTTHQLPWFISASLPNLKGIKNRVEGIMWIYARWLMKRCAKVITPTITIAELVHAKTGINPIVISNGVDLDIFCRKERNQSVNKYLVQNIGIPKDVPLILYVGRLDIDKEVNDIVDAAAEAIRKKEAHLLIVGDGTQKTKLIKKCCELGIENQSHFPGFIQEKALISSIYRRASVFVSASQIETQGLTLLEAAACGIPIVAYRATCIPEIVINNANGRLVEPGDKDALADAIVEIISQPKLAKSMGKAGHKIASQHAVRSTVNSYEQLSMRIIEANLSYPAAQLKALPSRVSQPDAFD